MLFGMSIAVHNKACRTIITEGQKFVDRMQIWSLYYGMQFREVHSSAPGHPGSLLTWYGLLVASLQCTRRLRQSVETRKPLQLTTVCMLHAIIITALRQLEWTSRGDRRKGSREQGAYCRLKDFNVSDMFYPAEQAKFQHEENVVLEYPGP